MGLSRWPQEANAITGVRERREWWVAYGIQMVVRSGSELLIFVQAANLRNSQHRLYGPSPRRRPHATVEQQATATAEKG
jgi:hypothetical protein